MGEDAGEITAVPGRDPLRGEALRVGLRQHRDGVACAPRQRPASLRQLLEAGVEIRDLAWQQVRGGCA